MYQRDLSGARLRINSKFVCLNIIENILKKVKILLEFYKRKKQ